MNEVGYVKRGRGYGRVVILSRYTLPKCEAVKWRWENNGIDEPHITDHRKVLSVHPNGDIIRIEKLRESIALAIESKGWISLTNLGKKLNRSARGLWPVCRVLEREGVVQMGTETWRRPYGNVIHFRTLVRKTK